MDALNVTCPSGRVASGRGQDRVKGALYDERGERYDIPAWVLTDPADVVEDAVEKDVEAGASIISDDDEEQEDPDARQRRRDEKGKGRQQDLGEIIKVRCRLSDRGSDVVVSGIGTKQRVSVIIRRIQEQIGTKRVRLVYLGKPLDENKTLHEQGWSLGNVLNAYVFEGDESILVAKKEASKG